MHLQEIILAYKKKKKKTDLKSVEERANNLEC